MDSDTPYLLIGDNALREAIKWPGLYYDIGELWHKHTGLPFTFALWIANKNNCSEKAGLYRKFINDLDRAKISALKNLDIVAASCPMKDMLSTEALIAYWKRMSFDFTDEHRKSLELFNAYSKKLGITLPQYSSKKKAFPQKRKHF